MRWLLYCSQHACYEWTACHQRLFVGWWHRVNAVCPGPILTEGTARHAASEGKSVEELCAEMSSQLILKRMGRVEEVAAAVAFLASEESSFMTGTFLTVDGGLTAL